MNLSSAISTLEASIEHQLSLSGGDQGVESTARAILGALEPAVRQIAFDLAQQASEEVAAQLPDHEVEVVLIEGDPSIRVRAGEADSELTVGDYEARLTLRLPDQLKSLVEEAADQAGDSVNTWVVKTLSSRARRRGTRGGRVTGSFEL
jgi:hypothetical protein